MHITLRIFFIKLSKGRHIFESHIYSMSQDQCPGFSGSTFFRVWVQVLEVSPKVDCHFILITFMS